MIDTASIEDIRKAAKKGTPLVVAARDDSFNRKVLEVGKNIILASPEKGKKASLKQIDSGLNHVLLAIAAKQGNSIGVDLKEIKMLSKRNKAERLARLIQNIRLCRKKKVSLVFSEGTEVSSLLLSLGASTQQAKNSRTQSF